MRYWNILLLLTLIGVMSACDKQSMSQVMVLQGKVMGTVWRVVLFGVDSVHKKALQQAIQRQLDADDHMLSTWKPDSLLSRFNSYQGYAMQPISADMADIVTKALRIGAKTKGAMDITIGRLVNLWGFGSVKQPVHMPTDAEITLVKTQTGLQHLRVIQTVAGQWLQKKKSGTLC